MRFAKHRGARIKINRQWSLPEIVACHWLCGRNVTTEASKCPGLQTLPDRGRDCVWRGERPDCLGHDCVLRSRKLQGRIVMRAAEGPFRPGDFGALEVG